MIINALGVDNDTRYSTTAAYITCVRETNRRYIIKSRKLLTLYL